jgi:hypothetical protein
MLQDLLPEQGSVGPSETFSVMAGPRGSLYLFNQLAALSLGSSGMKLRSNVAIAAITLLCVYVVTDAYARGRSRCHRAATSCGSGCSSWGGSYSSCGSSGGSYQPICQVVQTTNVSAASFGSCGGTGGSYTNCGSVGGTYGGQASDSSSIVLHSGVASETVMIDGQWVQVTYGPWSPTVAPQLLLPNPSQVVGQFKNPQTTSITLTAPVSKVDNSTPTAKVEPAQPTPTPAEQPEDRSVLVTDDSESGPCAYLVLRDLPADAEVYLVDMKMTARGSLRKYRIPVRTTDTPYDYPIEIRLPDSEEATAKATVQVRAGETTELLVSHLNDRLIVSDPKENKLEKSVPLASR